MLDSPARLANKHLNASQRSAQDRDTSERAAAQSPRCGQDLGRSGEVSQSQRNDQLPQPSQSDNTTSAFQTQDMGTRGEVKQRSSFSTTCKPGFVAVNGPQPKRSTSVRYRTLPVQAGSQGNGYIAMSQELPTSAQRPRYVSPYELSPDPRFESFDAPCPKWNPIDHLPIRPEDRLHPDGIHYHEPTDTQPSCQLADGESQDCSSADLSNHSHRQNRTKNAVASYTYAAPTEEPFATYLVIFIERTHEDPIHQIKGIFSSAAAAAKRVKQVYYEEGEGGMYYDCDLHKCRGPCPPESDGFRYKGKTEDSCLWWKAIDSEGIGSEVRVVRMVLGDEHVNVVL